MGMYIGNRCRLSISIVLVATMVLSAVAVLSFARTSFGVVGNTVTIGSDTVQPGQSVSVPVDAFVSPDLLGAATIEVDYDPSVIDATGCTREPSFDAGFCIFDFEHDGANPDTVKFNVIEILDPVSGNIHLADITFQAVGQPGESSALDVRIEVLVDTDGQPITVTDVDGQINIPATPTTTATPIPTSTATAPPTSTAAATPTPTATAAPTATPAPTATATATPTPALATPNSSPTPTPTATATPFASPSPTPNAGHSWGDVDCSGAIGPVDALKILRADAGLSVSQEADCPEIGSTVLLN